MANRTHSQVKLGLDVLTLGYHYMPVDNDAAFLHKIAPSVLANLFDKHPGADMAMLPLSQGGSVNPGNAFVRSTPASIGVLFPLWLDGQRANLKPLGAGLGPASVHEGGDEASCPLAEVPDT